MEASDGSEVSVCSLRDGKVCCLLITQGVMFGMEAGGL